MSKSTSEERIAMNYLDSYKRRTKHAGRKHTRMGTHPQRRTVLSWYPAIVHRTHTPSPDVARPGRGVYYPALPTRRRSDGGQAGAGGEPPIHAVDFRAYLEKAFQFSKRQVHPGDCVQVIQWGPGCVESIQGGRVKVRNGDFGTTGAVIYAPYDRCEQSG